MKANITGLFYCTYVKFPKDYTPFCLLKQRLEKRERRREGKVSAVGLSYQGKAGGDISEASGWREKRCCHFTHRKWEREKGSEKGKEGGKETDGLWHTQERLLYPLQCPSAIMNNIMAAWNVTGPTPHPPNPTSQDEWSLKMSAVHQYHCERVCFHVTQGRRCSQRCIIIHTHTKMWLSQGPVQLVEMPRVYQKFPLMAQITHYNLHDI